MVLAAIMTAIMATIIFFFLIPNPEEVGIYVEEMTEKEVLIESAV